MRAAVLMMKEVGGCFYYCVITHDTVNNKKIIYRNNISSYHPDSRPDPNNKISRYIPHL